MQTARPRITAGSSRYSKPQSSACRKCIARVNVGACVAQPCPSGGLAVEQHLDPAHRRLRGERPTHQHGGTPRARWRELPESRRARGRCLLPSASGGRLGHPRSAETPCIAGTSGASLLLRAGSRSVLSNRLFIRRETACTSFCSSARRARPACRRSSSSSVLLGAPGRW